MVQKEKDVRRQDEGGKADRRYAGLDLFAAAREGHKKALTELLYTEGVDPNVTRWSGVTALHRAAGEGQLEAVRILVKAGGDVNARTSLGWQTPLHMACGSGHEAVALELVEHDAKMSAKDKAGKTALKWAVDAGFSMMGRRLDEHFVRLQKKRSKEHEAEFNAKMAARKAREAELAAAAAKQGKHEHHFSHTSSDAWDLPHDHPDNVAKFKEQHEHHHSHIRRHTHLEPTKAEQYREEHGKHFAQHLHPEGGPSDREVHEPAGLGHADEDSLADLEGAGLSGL